MMDGDVDPIVDALRRLGGEAPSGLSAKVFSNWMALPSRLGEVFVAFTGNGVAFLRSAESVHSDPREFLENYRNRFGRPLRPAPRPPRGLLLALRGRSAASLRLDLGTLTDFERSVLTVTRQIPSGETRPYGWIAREAGRAGAIRAAASALARNPVPLLIPCHRVVRADGGVGDYIFGTTHKEELLRAENVNVDEVADLASQGVHYLASDTTGVVCFPTCHHARRITATHRHGFARVAVAIEAGYRPCRHCRPSVIEVA